MGYSGTNRMLWGDDPQDVMDSARRKFRTFDPNKSPVARRRLVAGKLLADKTLRIRINKVYQRDVRRPANNLEFKNLVKVTTNLGGRTIYWGPSRKAKARAKK